MKSKTLELRALPTLLEQRNALLDEMDRIVNGAGEQTRALNDTETARYTEIKQEIGRIDATLRAEQERRSLDLPTPEDAKQEETRAMEEDRFLRFLHGEQRALDIANNKAIIPTTIADRIIEKVKELSPIYSLATVYNIAGNLAFPVYDDSASSIKAAYVNDMEELTEGTGKFQIVTLENQIAGCLAKISRSLTNRTDFDLVDYTVQKVAEAIVEFLERECLNGTPGKMSGVFSSEYGVTAASATAVTADELIDLQDTVPDRYQPNACWIMSKATRRAVRKLKDNDGNYLLNKDLTAPFGYVLLGKPIYVSDSCPDMAAGKKAIVYGDMSGLYIKLAQQVEIQILMEKYATQHAIGVVGYIECDSKVIEPQKLAVMTMKGAASGG